MPLLSLCDVHLQKSDSPLCGALQRERKAKETAEKEVPQWKVNEVRALVEALLQHGEGRTTAARAGVSTLFWMLFANCFVMAVMAAQAVCMLPNCIFSGVAASCISWQVCLTRLAGTRLMHVTVCGVKSALLQHDSNRTGSRIHGLDIQSTPGAKVSFFGNCRRAWSTMRLRMLRLSSNLWWR